MPGYRDAAVSVGRLLAHEGITLIYGGGNVGLMGEIADSAMANGGRAIGVIPRALMEKEVAHRGVSELLVVADMHERKKKMAELADAFVALPGGIGTLEEIFEAFTWSQLGIHDKPCGFLNTCGYYDELIRFLGHMVEQRFLKKEHWESLIIEHDENLLLSRLKTCVPKKIEKWIDRGTPEAAARDAVR
jgi:hypothetical protein